MVQEKIPGNSTLLIPDDQLLSDIFIPEDEVIEFISRHLIPSRLLLHHLTDLPNRTMLPTNNQGYMLTISRNGTTKFLFNNAELVLPNICVAGTIACHVMFQEKSYHTRTIREFYRFSISNTGL